MSKLHKIEHVYDTRQRGRHKPLPASTDRQHHHRHRSLVSTPRPDPVQMLFKAVHQASPFPSPALPLLPSRGTPISMTTPQIDDANVTPSGCDYQSSPVGCEGQSVSRRRARAR